jgi:hypothetical protein
MGSAPNLRKNRLNLPPPVYLCFRHNPCPIKQHFPNAISVQRSLLRHWNIMVRPKRRTSFLGGRSLWLNKNQSMLPAQRAVLPAKAEEITCRSQRPIHRRQKPARSQRRRNRNGSVLAIGTPRAKSNSNVNPSSCKPIIPFSISSPSPTFPTPSENTAPSHPAVYTPPTAGAHGHSLRTWAGFV